MEAAMRLMLIQLLCAAPMLFLSPALAQDLDLSVVAGVGGFAGDEAKKGGVAAVGASVGFPYDSKHRFQFDWLSNKLLGGSQGNEAIFYLTGSYVIQSTRSRIRPFLQIGAGLARVKHLSWSLLPNIGTITNPEKRRNSGAVIFGVGTTVRLKKSLFLRPQVRVYGHVGPTFAVVPSLGIGWRF